MPAPWRRGFPRCSDGSSDCCDRRSLVERIHRDVLERVGLTDPELETTVVALVEAAAPLGSVGDREEITRQVLARINGLGPLEPLLEAADVTDVMVNGPGPVWIERHGGVEATAVVLDEADVGRLVERIVALVGRRVDLRSPTVDARLPDGSRVNVAVAPVAVDGPYVTIRRFRLLDVTPEAFAGRRCAS